MAHLQANGMTPGDPEAVIVPEAVAKLVEQRLESHVSYKGLWASLIALLMLLFAMVSMLLSPVKDVTKETAARLDRIEKRLDSLFVPLARPPIIAEEKTP